MTDRQSKHATELKQNWILDLWSLHQTEIDAQIYAGRRWHNGQNSHGVSSRPEFAKQKINLSFYLNQTTCSDLREGRNHRDALLMLLDEDTEVAFFYLSMAIPIKLMDSEATFSSVDWGPPPHTHTPLKREPFSLGQAHFDSLIPAPEWPFSNSNGDRYIKAALQPLGNIFRNQNSLALMTEWAGERERERMTLFFSVTGRATGSISACWDLIGRKKNVYFSHFGHILDTQGICCPRCRAVWWLSVSECSCKSSSMRGRVR